MLAWEWPLGLLAGTALHKSIEARLVILPLVALAAALMYQSTNPAIYYTIGMGVYFWAYSEGEVCYPLIFMEDRNTNIPQTDGLWSSMDATFPSPSGKGLIDFDLRNLSNFLLYFIMMHIHASVFLAVGVDRAEESKWSRSQYIL